MPISKTNFSSARKIAFTATMFLYINLVLIIFWILKPLKKTLFIQQYNGSNPFKIGSLEMLGSSAELLAKGTNMLIAFLLVIFLTLITRIAKRQMLTFCCMGLIIAMTIFFAITINNPSESVIWSFYWFGDIYISLMLAAFFSFLHDTVDLKNAKSLYGFIILGAVSGGAIGSTYFRSLIDEMTHQQWLHLIIGIGLIICILAAFAGWMAKSIPNNEPDQASHEVSKQKFNAAIEGASLVFKSRYLLAIAGIVGLYEITSEVLDFQFTAITEIFVEESKLGSHFGTVYAIGNIAALAVQLGFSIFAAKYPSYRIHWALLVLPLAVAIGSLFFIIAPILIAGSFLKIADSTFAYSVNQTGRETLYNPLSQQKKYVARSFVEVFVQRTGKVIALLIAFIIPMLFNSYNEEGQLETSLIGLQILGVLTCVTVALWFYCVKIVGSKFEFLEKGHELSESQKLR